MDQATLVGPDVNTGSEVLTALDEGGLTANVAMLVVTADYGDWRLLLSSPDFDQQSERQAYLQILDILRGRFVYRLPQMLVLPQGDPFVREVRRLFGKTGDVQGMRLGGQMIGNRFIESAYVYRVR